MVYNRKIALISCLVELLENEIRLAHPIRNDMIFSEMDCTFHEIPNSENTPYFAFVSQDNYVYGLSITQIYPENDRSVEND